MIECPICKKKMEPDDNDEYEEGDVLFCFECGITNDSPSYYEAKQRNEEYEREWNKEHYGEWHND